MNAEGSGGKRGREAGGVRVPRDVVRRVTPLLQEKLWRIIEEGQGDVGNFWKIVSYCGGRKWACGRRSVKLE